jgi:cysteine dioxygenase|tara:strand:- start:5086 stop:5604 length:519 start_codon:yes stop_codon:yes gene_type:complete
LENLINEIKKLSKHDFPEDDVYDLLEGSLLSQKDIHDYILFNPDKYTRHLIHREESFELLVMCWRPGQKAPVHGHEGEKCFMRVEEGTLQFTNYTLESTTPLRLTISDTVKGDPGFLDGPADLHSVENIFQNNAVTFHLYAKPYGECDVFDIESGSIYRKKLIYDTMYKKPC